MAGVMHSPQRRYLAGLIYVFALSFLPEFVVAAHVPAWAAFGIFALGSDGGYYRTWYID